MRCDEGKAHYPSAAQATKVLIAWNAGYQKKHRPKKRTPPIRTYLCPFCGSWHLTSQEGKA